MLRRRRQHADDIGYLRRKDLVHIRKTMRNPETIRDVHRSRPIGIGNGHDVPSSDALQRREVLVFAHLTAADERNTKR